MKVKCDCKHEGQDELHGKGMRVANKISSKDGNMVRCTVCKKESRVSEKK
ncbi:hypothetical protein pVco7_gp108 [Vibrio phage pVco-7]|uniref:Uncharacterized protein n=1 Tax=Vibrio phage pVco-5 TaxID=1965485 RepID=A0A1W6JV16_9CAUD|nr:hypothetical protein KNT61_gp109 [Vibrio phage pVco-5]ARM71097.1 hypothetical protein pVco5_108 [Vibrio phage pVco-5]